MSRARRIALVTCDLQPKLFEEEGELVPRAKERGIEASIVSWTDPNVDWRSYDMVALRSTWDYFNRIDEWHAWLARLEALGVALQNPISLVRWNLDKRYLRELEAAGIPVVPTRFVEPGDPSDLAAILEQQGWDEAVIKPAISGGAARTYRVNRATAEARRAEWEEITGTGTALVQPFCREIVEEGEWSLFFFGGAYGYAILKVAAAGEYRIQSYFGGTAIRKNPDSSLIADALNVVNQLPVKPLYARIDGIKRDGRLYLMEAEVIEPYLFTAAAPEGFDLYLSAVEAALEVGSR